MPEDIREEIEIDEKTKRVFQRKGYKIDKHLNSGTFGKVYRAIKDGEEVYTAVKVMDLSAVSVKFKTKFLPRELAALIEVQHPNIVQTYDIFRSNRKIYIFMEFAGGGDIAGYINRNGPMDEPDACKWFTQVSNALSYLHNQKYLAHRDIKIDNILLTEDHKETKLTDFGLSKTAWDEDNGCVLLSETFCGTEPYYSPEILKKQKYDPFKADVWAMGVVLFVMLNNKFPFHFGKGKEHLKEINDQNFLSKRYIKKASKHCKHLIKEMFNTNETERIGIKEVYEHKWIREKGICKHH